MYQHRSLSNLLVDKLKECGERFWPKQGDGWIDQVEKQMMATPQHQVMRMRAGQLAATVTDGGSMAWLLARMHHCESSRLVVRAVYFVAKGQPLSYLVVH
jgi:hypothetical protein